MHKPDRNQSLRRFARVKTRVTDGFRLVLLLAVLFSSQSVFAATVCTPEVIGAKGENFNGISGSSDNNIIAVGSGAGKKGGGIVYYWNGSSWQMENPSPSNEGLNDVEVLSGNLAYAVGKNGKVIEYDGSSWNDLGAGKGDPPGEELKGVWSISSDEVWVVGKNQELSLWDGMNWLDMSGKGEANIDKKGELRDAWGDANNFYAVEKDGDIYNYRPRPYPNGSWSKITKCNDDFDMDINDIWGDSSGTIYLSGQNKGGGKKGKNKSAAVFAYREGPPATCDIEFSTTTGDKLEGISGNGSTIYAVGKGGLVADYTAGSWTENVVGGEDYKDVWVSSTGTPHYAGKNGVVTTCVSDVGITQFIISPFSTTASTCLSNAITITAAGALGMPVIDYEGTVSISTSSNHGIWIRNDADGLLVPEPNPDDGAVGYTFDLLDAGVIILDLANTHAETLTITVSDTAAGVSLTSVNLTYASNVFVISEEAVQVAGRPVAMNVAMWTDDLAGSATCGVDTSYNYAAIDLDAGIDRGGVLPAANDPLIGAVRIPDGGSTLPVTLNFSGGLGGQAGFDLDSDDVGQFRLTLTDNTNNHGDTPITGIGNLLTLKPFGIAVDNIFDTLSTDPNLGNTAAASLSFSSAGNDLSATVSGVLWDAADDVNDDGVLDNGPLDTGVYSDNTTAPSYAWDTVLTVSLLASSYTPSPGTPGVLNNNSIALADFSAGAAPVIDLQYTEVGSFTLQAIASNYLGLPSPGGDILGDGVVVGRFIPAAFEVSIAVNGIFADACGAFTYIGQDFGYTTAPSFAVTAVNQQGVRTAQYRDTFAKLDDSSVTVVATRDESKTGTDMVLLNVSYSPLAMTVTPQNNGIVSYIMGADSYRYGPSDPLGNFSKEANSQVDSFTADIRPEITLIADGEVSTPYVADTHEFTPVGNNLLFGRLRMDNVHGSELNPLVMPVFTEFWNGFSFQKNLLDTCTVIAAGNLSSVANPVGLSVPAVVFPLASAGDVNYSYPAPGAGNDGFIDTITDLSAAAHLWLRYDWIVDGVFDDDPSARATFGIYEGDPVQIYLQQIYE